MAVTSTETNGMHSRVRSIMEEERKQRPTSAGLNRKRVVLDRSPVAYPDSLSAAYSNDDIIRAISLDQLSSRAASRTSITSLSVSQIISECADSDNEEQTAKPMKEEDVEYQFRRLVVEGDDSENEWFGEDEHTQSELHVTRADDVAMSETDATIVHVVRKRTIMFGTANSSSETSGASSNGSDVMVELSDASSTCITVTGDEAIKQNEEFPHQTFNSISGAGSGEDEKGGLWNGMADSNLKVGREIKEAVNQPFLIPENSSPQLSSQSPAPVTSSGNVLEFKKEVNLVDGDSSISLRTQGKDGSLLVDVLAQETEPEKGKEEEETEEESDEEATLGEDEASQSASESSVISTPGENTQEENPSTSTSTLSSSYGSTPMMKKSILAPLFPNKEAVAPSGLPPASEDNDDLLDTESVISTIDLGDVDVEERTVGPVAKLLTEDGEDDNTPLLSIKFPPMSASSSFTGHPLLRARTVLDSGSGELMSLQQRLVEMEREQTKMREQMDWERAQWRTANTDLQLSLQQLQTKLEDELKKRDAQLRAMEKRLRTAEGRTTSFMPQAKPFERSSMRRQSARVSPQQAEKLRRFFGDNPPLLERFLEDLGYKEYIPRFLNEKISFMELPHLSEWDLINLGIPLGPRLRILHEAQLLTSL